MYLEKLEFTSDYDRMITECDTLIKTISWMSTNQIGLNCRPGVHNKWTDAAGSLQNRQTGERRANEWDFTEWNLNNDNYIRQQIEHLAELESAKLGRIRIMRLMPKTGLSIHADLEIRYHYVLYTNPKSFFCFNETVPNSNSVLPVKALCYHIPRDYHWYKVDTTKVHWVYNGGETDRVHLVVCGT